MHKKRILEMLILKYLQTNCWDKYFGLQQLKYFHLIGKKHKQ